MGTIVSANVRATYSIFTSDDSWKTFQVKLALIVGFMSIPVIVLPLVKQKSRKGGQKELFSCSNEGDGKKEKLKSLTTSTVLKTWQKWWPLFKSLVM